MRQLGSLERWHAPASGQRLGPPVLGLLPRPSPPSDAEGKADDPGDPVTHTSEHWANPQPTPPWEAGFVPLWSGDSLAGCT